MVRRHRVPEIEIEVALAGVRALVEEMHRLAAQDPPQELLELWPGEELRRELLALGIWLMVKAENWPENRG